MNERDNRRNYVRDKQIPESYKKIKKIIIICLLVLVTPIIVLSMLDPANWWIIIFVTIMTPLWVRR
jgi:hypothetical protein